MTVSYVGLATTRGGSSDGATLDDDEYFGITIREIKRQKVKASGIQTWW